MYKAFFLLSIVQVSRKDFKVTAEVLEKPEMFVQADEEGGGVKKVAVAKGTEKEAALSEDQVIAIGRLMVDLEVKMGRPQDFEWAYEKGACW